MVKNLPTIERSTKIRFGKHASDDQAENTVVFNATDSVINAINEGSIYMAPLRVAELAGSNLVGYSASTKEVVDSGVATELLGGVTLDSAGIQGNVVSNSIPHFANITTAFTTDHGSNVGISNTSPTHMLSVGDKIFMSNTGTEVIKVEGNVQANKFFTGSSVIIDQNATNKIQVSGTIKTGALHADNIGIANTSPTHALSLGNEGQLRLNVPTESIYALETVGNVSAQNYIGDGGLLSNVTLQTVTDKSNVTSNTIHLTNPTTSLKAYSNVIVDGTLDVGSNLYVNDTAADVLNVTGNVNVSNYLKTNKLEVTSLEVDAVTAGTVSSNIVGNNVNVITVTANVVADNVVATNISSVTLNSNIIADNVSATTITGDGSAITNLDPANLSSQVLLAKGGTGLTAVAQNELLLGPASGTALAKLAPYVPSAGGNSPPNMSANSSGGNTASSSDSSANAWKVFDGNDNIEYTSPSTYSYSSPYGYTGSNSLGGNDGEWIKIQLSSAIAPTSVYAQTNGMTSNPQPTTWRILASNDDTNWTQLHSSTTTISNSGITESFVNTTSYTYLAILVEKITNPGMNLNRWGLSKLYFTSPASTTSEKFLKSSAAGIVWDEVSSTLQTITDGGASTTNEISFTNGVTSLTASGNVVVTGNVTASTFKSTTLTSGKIPYTNANKELIDGPIGHDSTTNNTFVSSNLYVTGNLTVQGTTTFQDSNIHTVSDPIIEIGNANAIDTIDMGVIMTRPTANVVSGYMGDEKKYVIAYTLSDPDGAHFVPTNATSDQFMTLSVEGGNVLAGNVTTTGKMTAGTLHGDSITVSGAVTGSTLVGDGSSITSLDAEKITTGAVDVDHGGTNIASYTAGDLLYATGATTLAKLGVDNGKFLKSTASAVEWADVSSDLQTITDGGATTTQTVAFNNTTTGLTSAGDIDIAATKQIDYAGDVLLKSSAGAVASLKVTNAIKLDPGPAAVTVPVAMTANSSGGNTASAGYGSTNAWKAFDGSDSTTYTSEQWAYNPSTDSYTSSQSLGGISGDWLKIQLASAIIPISVFVKGGAGSGAGSSTGVPDEWRILGSNDDTNWTQLHSSTTAVDQSSGTTESFINTTAYSYIAIVVTSVTQPGMGGWHWHLSRLSFTASPPPSNNVLSFNTTTGEIYDSGGQGGSTLDNIHEEGSNVAIGPSAASANLTVNTYGSNVLTVSGNVSADSITIGNLNVAASPFALDDVVSINAGANVTANVLTLGGLVTSGNVDASNITISGNTTSQNIKLTNTDISATISSGTITIDAREKSYGTAPLVVSTTDVSNLVFSNLITGAQIVVPILASGGDIKISKELTNVNFYAMTTDVSVTQDKHALMTLSNLYGNIYMNAIGFA